MDITKKPYELRFLESKKQLVDTVNYIIENQHISYILLDSILQDIYRQVSTAAKNEQANLEAKYNEYLYSCTLDNKNFEDITDKVVCDDELQTTEEEKF